MVIWQWLILYLYAIVDGLESVGGRRGAAAEPLRLLTCEALTAVVGTLAAMPALDQAALEAQDRVVRTLHADAEALLPMRFGAAFPDEAAIARALKTKAPALGEALALVRTREQMTLRILGAPGPPSRPEAATARSGTQYLQQRAAAATPSDIVPLLAALGTLQHGTRVEPGRTPGVIATVYQLIDRGRSAEYRDIAAAAAGELRGLSVRISGPSPCYAFAP